MSFPLPYFPRITKNITCHHSCVFGHHYLLLNQWPMFITLSSNTKTTTHDLICILLSFLPSTAVVTCQVLSLLRWERQ